MKTSSLLLPALALFFVSRSLADPTTPPSAAIPLPPAAIAAAAPASVAQIILTEARLGFKYQDPDRPAASPAGAATVPVADGRPVKAPSAHAVVYSVTPSPDFDHAAGDPTQWYPSLSIALLTHRDHNS